MRTQARRFGAGCLLTVVLASCAADDPTTAISDAGAEDDGRPDRPESDADTDSGLGDAEVDADTDASVDGSGVGDTDAADPDAPADTDVGESDADAGDVATADTNDPDGVDPDAGPACPEAPEAYTGVRVEDVNGDPLRVGDVVRVTVEVLGSASVPLTLQVDNNNLLLNAASLEVTGAGVGVPRAVGQDLYVEVSGAPGSTLVFEADTIADTELVTVLARLEQRAGDCVVPRSRSAAILQLGGGNEKTSTCIDMGQYRSVQVAPLVALQNTASYESLNGAREDLLADDFIFCPQYPTIVHAAEFCVQRASGQRVTLAGTYRADGDWEVDDFMLFEVFSRGLLVADGFTSQSHTGGSTFWCGEISQLMCQTGCTASLTEVATSRSLETLAVAPAQGASARRHVDGAVDVGRLIPDDGTRVDLRITALDQGVEGTLRPGLYLIGE